MPLNNSGTLSLVNPLAEGRKLFPSVVFFFLINYSQFNLTHPPNQWKTDVIVPKRAKKSVLTPIFFHFGNTM